MTGYTVHTGSTVKFSAGWDLIFQGTKTAKSSSIPQSANARKPEAVNKKLAGKSAKKSAVKVARSSSTASTVKKSAKKAAKRGK